MSLVLDLLFSTLVYNKSCKLRQISDAPIEYHGCDIELENLLQACLFLKNLSISPVVFLLQHMSLAVIFSVLHFALHTNIRFDVVKSLGQKTRFIQVCISLYMLSTDSDF